MEVKSIVLVNQVLQLHWLYYGIAFFITIFMGFLFHRFLAGLLSGYVFLIIVLTIISRPVGESAKIELIPFWSYFAYLNDPGNSVLTQIIANIVLFIPIGIMLGILLNDLRQSLLFGFLLSVAIELTQLTTCRGLFEVDDLIHNSVGVYIGLKMNSLFDISNLLKRTAKKWKGRSK